jgi:hypothetical protein
MTARKLMEKGCETFMAYIIDSMKDNTPEMGVKASWPSSHSMKMFKAASFSCDEKCSQNLNLISIHDFYIYIFKSIKNSINIKKFDISIFSV